MKPTALVGTLLLGCLGAPVSMAAERAIADEIIRELVVERDDYVASMFDGRSTRELSEELAAKLELLPEQVVILDGRHPDFRAGDSSESLSCATPCSVGLLNNQLNDYYDVVLACDNGAFSARTSTLHPDGDNLNVIFGGSGLGAGTSDVTFFVHNNNTSYLDPANGRACAFDPPDTVYEPNSHGLEAEWTRTPLPGLDLTLREEIVAFGDTNDNSGVRLTMCVRNAATSTVDASMGLRWQIDYQNGGDDGPLFALVNCDPFSVGQPTDLEQQIAPSLIQDFYRIQNNTGTPIFGNFSSTATILGWPASRKPDRLVYGRWPMLNASGWTYAPAPFSADQDSAVLYYYGYLPADALAVAPGESICRSVIIFTKGNSQDCGVFQECELPTAAFAASETQACLGCTPLQFVDQSLGNPTPVLWDWDFADGETSREQHPSHLFRMPGTYDVNLVATSVCGPSDPFTTTIDIVNLPTSDFSAPATGCVGSAIDFTNLSSPDSTCWTWDFGDTSTDTVMNPSHVYAAPGIYTVSLAACNACGDASPEFRNIEVINAPGASFTSDGPRCSGPVCFEDTSSGSPTGWIWDFGDGTGSSTQQNPCYTYAADGTYAVTLTTTNACGTSQEFRADVTVDAGLGSTFSRWTSCESPRAPGTAGCPPYHCPEDTTTATTVSDSWEFNDDLFCRPTACTFAMYAVADCGTSMNFPFFDVETGHMRVFDILAGQYVTISAQNNSVVCPWSQSDVTDVQWADAACDGTDCRFNAVTTTVSFTGTPAVCGVYRLEFIDWAGFWWDLFANCDGTNTPGFLIYDNICDAIAAYDPLPDLSISNVVINGVCPEFSISFDVLNSGCVPADATVRASSSLGGTTDVILTGVEPGVVRSGTIALAVPACTAGETITVAVDPDDAVLECAQALGSAVSCNPNPTQGQVVTQPMPGCLSPPSFCGIAGAADINSCLGTGVRLTWPTALDAGSGASVEYEIYRDDVLINTTTNTQYVDIPPLTDTPYRYRIQARSDCGLLDMSAVEIVAADLSCSPVCGDGVLLGAEECDDGNLLDGDGCRSDCTVEECGDGLVDSGEACDDGNIDGGDGCRVNCTEELCGDGILDIGEVCDDNNGVPGDGCRGDCTEEVCGDNQLDPSEVCDDGNTVGGDGCRANCTPEVCGDGLLDPGELCDDGNSVPGDGCDAGCLLEQPSSCGDGVLDIAEQCDDGNLITGDGCRANCTIERCGDGILDPLEVCDDANSQSGDGCRGNCTLEVCGDSILDPSERCDDGNRVGGDGCRADCTVERCGDVILDVGEDCDDGNTTIGDGCRADCSLEMCGDGLLDGGEACDDGNLINGDGCDAVCRFENFTSCGDGVVDLGELCDDGNNVGGDGCRADCTVEQCGDHVLDPGESCDDGNVAGGDGCSDLCVLEGPIPCGNGVLDAGESCDDGNNTGGDGCRADCTLESCGDLVLDPGEACDDGNLSSGDGCGPSCLLEAPFCGDGRLSSTEECDDGNTVSGDGCRGNCTLEDCGDGILDGGEACDDGNGMGGDGCRIDCTRELCGDGIVDPQEACDDGNFLGGDGCRADCTNELCGDGILDLDEVCDDGNTTGGDGCRFDCTVEWCGDSIIDPGELCDDGNNQNGDGCSANCLASCGDGVTGSGEQCDDSGESVSCNSNCTFATCGDRILNTTAGEECDDGNTVAGDGCDASCINECVAGDILSIRPLFAIKSTDRLSVELSHPADATANGYNTWVVTVKSDIPNARAGGVGVNPANCGPSALPACTDDNAVDPTAGTRLFYQVRGVCGANEAPE